MEIREDVDDDGIFSIYTDVEYEGESIEVQVRYPAGFPYMPPKVFGPAGTLERHQNPNGGNFCLTDNDDNWWRPEYPATALIAQLHGLFEAASSGEQAVAGGEANMPEPFTGHHHFSDEVTVLVGQAMLEEEIGAKSGRFSLREVRQGLYTFQSMSSENGSTIGALDDRISKALGIDGESGEIEGSWVQHPTVPKPDDLKDIVEKAAGEAAKNEGKTRVRGPGKKRLKTVDFYWVGVTFFEQGSQRDGLRRAWIFVKFDRNESGKIRYENFGTQAVSSKVRGERIPELSKLTERRFLLVGAGSVGGTVALELARAGVGHIDIIDSDHFDVNNSVRHVLPATAAGKSKALEVAGMAQLLSLETKAVGHHWSAGNGEKMVELTDLVDAADVVIDASGSRAAARLVHSIASEAGKPLVSLALTPGAFGGRVVVLRGANPCLDCFFHHRDDGSIPSAPEAEESNVTPYGCSHPAASAAGFDVAELAIVGTRAAVQVADPGDYPPADGDWIVVSFRDFKEGERYQEGSLSLHPNCLWCE